MHTRSGAMSGVVVAQIPYKYTIYIFRKHYKNLSCFAFLNLYRAYPVLANPLFS